MLRLLSSLLTLVFLAFATAFAMANKAEITLGLWPLETGIALPLYAVGLGALFLGLVVGGFLSWAHMLPHRFEASRLRKQIEKERAEAASREIKNLSPSKPKFWSLFS